MKILTCCATILILIISLNEAKEIKKCNLNLVARGRCNNDQIVCAVDANGNVIYFILKKFSSKYKPIAQLAWHVLIPLLMDM